MFGFIGIGQGGSGVVDEMSKLGYPSLAMNYSQRDLDALEHVTNKLCFVGSEGVGKQREIAISLMKDNWESAVSYAQQNLSQPSIEVIFVVFSTGGGSGSGTAPILIDILTNQMPDKVFVACPILPDISEVLVNQVNTVNVFEELAKLDICVLPIDNQKAVTSGLIPKNKIYNVVNTTFAKIIDEIAKYTEKHSKNGNLDKKDLRQIFNTKGIATIGTTSVKSLIESPIELTQDRFNNIVYSSWEKSVFTDIEFDQIVRAGVVFDGDEELMQFLDYSKIFSKFKNPVLDLFEGNYHDKLGTVTTILSGLSWCNTRLQQIEYLIEQNEQVMHDVFSQPEKRFETKINMNDFTSRFRKQPKKTVSIDEIMSKYQR